MKSSKVLISILNWNAPENTINTIKSVLMSTYSDYSVLLIDNNSSDNSEAKLTYAFPNILFHKMRSNVGYAAAHKVAAKKAMREGFDLLWILNNDVEVFPDTLLELVKAYERRGDCLFGSVALHADKETIAFAGGLELNGDQLFDGGSEYNQYAGKKISGVYVEEKIVSGVQGSSFLIPVSIIREFGFMDTRFFLYGEETEYCYRLRKKFGTATLIIPSSTVIHAGGGSFQKSEKLVFIRTYYATRNGNLVHHRYQKDVPVYEMKLSRIPFYIKFFVRHFFLRSSAKKDHQYWVRYYRELGNLHSLLRIKGKYLAPEKFVPF